MSAWVVTGSPSSSSGAAQAKVPWEVMLLMWLLVITRAMPTSAILAR